MHAGSMLFRTESEPLGRGPEGTARGDCSLPPRRTPQTLPPPASLDQDIQQMLENVMWLDLDLPEVVGGLIPHMRDF